AVDVASGLSRPSGLGRPDRLVARMECLARGLPSVGNGTDRVGRGQCPNQIGECGVKTGVAIVGASGYGSRELMRILLNHPGAKIAMATSRDVEAPRVAELHPSLLGRIDLACEPFDADKVASVASVAFLGLPHTASL